MRHIFHRSATLLLSLVALIGAPTLISAQRGGRPEARRPEVRHFEPVHAIARTGSIHYGARAGRDPVHVPVGPVRPVGGGYRNPYRADYFRHFRPGYRPIYLGGAQYYIYDTLPLGCQQIPANGVIYDLCDGVYYQPYIYGGQTVYLVVPPPV